MTMKSSIPPLAGLIHEHFKQQGKDFAFEGELLELSNAVSSHGLLPGLIGAAQLELSMRGVSVDLGFILVPDESSLLGFYVETREPSFEQYFFRFSSILEVIEHLESEPNIIYTDNLREVLKHPSLEQYISLEEQPAPAIS